jgi:hypothetical protein
MADDDFEIIEPADYTHKKDEPYSHSSLVMSVLKKAIDNGSKEMRDGYWNTKFDRFGNAHKVWIPDSRQEFIETVDSLIMIQERDFDDAAKKKIKEIKEELDEKYKKYCELEAEEWKRFDVRRKQQLSLNGSYFREGMLSEDLPYRFEYIRDKVAASRKIVSEVQQLIKRMFDYAEEMFEA